MTLVVAAAYRQVKGDKTRPVQLSRYAHVRSRRDTFSDCGHDAACSRSQWNTLPTDERPDCHGNRDVNPRGAMQSANSRPCSIAHSDDILGSFIAEGWQFPGVSSSVFTRPHP